MSTLPEPPPNIPRIVDVLDPGTNQHVVLVRMPTNITSKFPAKPWGTSISEIGLAPKDADQFDGYTLVEVEPIKGSPDLYWLFQKLNGPVWTSRSLGQESLIPAKYRGQVTTTRTKQEVTPSTTPTAIIGNIVSSIVEDQENTGKALKIDTTETISSNGNSLDGEEFGDIVTKETSESLVSDGTDADSTIDVISSIVEPIGNGMSVKTTKKAKGGWPVPVEEEMSVEVDNLIPNKFRGQILRGITTEKVAAMPDGIALVTGEVAVSYKRETPSRIEKKTISETIAESSTALTGKAAYVERQIADTSEKIVEDDDVLINSGLNVISSSITPLGNGKSIKQDVTVPSWNVHHSAEWREELEDHIIRTEQFVSAMDAQSSLSDYADYQIVNTDRSLKVSAIVPTDALNSYVLSYPKKISLDLPRILTAVDIIWNTSEDIGERDNDFQNLAYGSTWSLSGDNSDAANSSGGAVPEVQLTFEDYATSHLYAKGYEFYLPKKVAGIYAVNESTILNKLNYLIGSTVEMWPSFRTKSSTITLLGQSASVRVQTSASSHYTKTDGAVVKEGKQSGYGDDVSRSLSNGVVTIPPCLHDQINFTGEATKTISITATAESPIYSTYGHTLVPTHSRTVEVTASVSPSSLSATSPTTIPTSGLYLMDSAVKEYGYGYVKVFADVFDASQLSPS